MLKNLKLEIQEICNLNEVQSYLSTREENNPWRGTVIEDISLLCNSQKGVCGELIVSSYMEKNGYIIEKRNNISNDRIIKTNENVKYRVEIKTSIPLNKNVAINHIAKSKKWDRLIIFVCHPVDLQIYMLWFSKKDFVSSIEKNENFFKVQQGGKLSTNDDYIVNFEKLRNWKYLREMDEW